jgi:hypothetical protein
MPPTLDWLPGQMRRGLGGVHLFHRPSERRYCQPQGHGQAGEDEQDAQQRRYEQHRADDEQRGQLGEVPAQGDAMRG